MRLCEGDLDVHISAACLLTTDNRHPLLISAHPFRFNANDNTPDLLAWRLDDNVPHAQLAPNSQQVKRSAQMRFVSSLSDT